MLTRNRDAWLAEGTLVKFAWTYYSRREKAPAPTDKVKQNNLKDVGKRKKKIQISLFSMKNETHLSTD